MKKPTQEILNAAQAEREAGATIKEVLAKPRNKAGDTLSYSQFWYFLERGKVAGTKADLAGVAGDEEKLAQGIAEQRNGGVSWGQIAVNANLPESRIRKIWAESTGVRSEGLRIGAGGRYLRDDAVFYTGGEKPVAGTAIPVTKKVIEIQGQLRKEIDLARERRAKAEAKKVAAKAAKAAKKVASPAPAPEAEAPKEEATTN